MYDCIIIASAKLHSATRWRGAPNPSRWAFLPPCCMLQAWQPASKLRIVLRQVALYVWDPLWSRRTREAVMLQAFSHGNVARAEVHSPPRHALGVRLCHRQRGGV